MDKPWDIIRESLPKPPIGAGKFYIFGLPIQIICIDDGEAQMRIGDSTNIFCGTDTCEFLSEFFAELSKQLA